MTNHNADRLRDAIARDQHWTLCRCGHILECCADCRAWLLENSPRIEVAWRLRMGGNLRFFGALADAAEADDRAYFGL